LKRREFLIGSAAVASAGRGWAQDASREAKLARVGVMSGCFGRLMAETWDRSQTVEPKELDIMDFPEMLADHYHIHNVEVQQIHFLSMEPSYYTKFLGRLKKAKSRMVDMPLELDDEASKYKGIVNPWSTDPQIRARAVDLTKQWIDRAAMIECPSVMLNQGPFGDDLTAPIAALKQLSAYGKSKNVAILLEPRGRSTVDVLVEVIKGAGIYANPDIGNIGDDEKTDRGLRMLYPLSLTVSHVKLSPRFDFAKAIQVSKEMGFKGVYSLEAGGPDPYNTVQKLLDELLKNL
jgi:hypothetical protein